MTPVDGADEHHAFQAHRPTFSNSRRRAKFQWRMPWFAILRPTGKPPQSR